MKRALITGITGQDGSYLAEILLERGWQVHGLHRRTSTGNLSRIAHLLERVTLHRGDLADPQSIYRAVVDARPEVIFNLADQDNVDFSFATPGYSADITASAVMRTLEMLRQSFSNSIRFFQPVSATIFGDAPPPQNESTPLNPLSPYAVCKAAAFHAARYYRQVHGMFVSTAILFNHDSPRRGGEYLLHKIVKGAMQNKLSLGCLDMVVDIGFAHEYMEAAVRMMQADAPDDYVIGTGRGVLIRELAHEAFRLAGGFRLGRSSADIDKLITVNPSFARPGKQPCLVADSGKARRELGFRPTYDAMGMVEVLVAHYRRQA